MDEHLLNQFYNARSSGPYYAAFHEAPGEDQWVPVPEPSANSNLAAPISGASGHNFTPKVPLQYDDTAFLPLPGAVIDRTPLPDWEVRPTDAMQSRIQECVVQTDKPNVMLFNPYTAAMPTASMSSRVYTNQPQKYNISYNNYSASWGDEANFTSALSESLPRGATRTLGFNARMNFQSMVPEPPSRLEQIPHESPTRVETHMSSPMSHGWCPQYYQEAVFSTMPVHSDARIPTQAESRPIYRRASTSTGLTSSQNASEPSHRPWPSEDHNPGFQNSQRYGLGPSSIRLETR